MTFIASTRRLLPAPLAAGLKAIYHALYPWSVRLRCVVADVTNGDATLPPAMLRYRVSESLSVRDFAAVGERCANDIERLLRQAGLTMTPSERVLDFGCGCGRTARWLLQRNTPVHLTGVDVDAEAIAWCESALRPATFVATAKCPPLPFADASFDAIYSISVFTHLDEALQDVWFAELHRLLRPGGVLLFSVHGHNAARVLDASGQASLAHHGHLHRTSNKLHSIVPDWYNTTWHSRQYIESRLATLFAAVRYEEIEDGIQDYVIVRRADSRTVTV